MALLACATFISGAIVASAVAQVMPPEDASAAAQRKPPNENPAPTDVSIRDSLDVRRAEDALIAVYRVRLRYHGDSEELVIVTSLSSDRETVIKTKGSFEDIGAVFTFNRNATSVTVETRWWIGNRSGHRRKSGSG